MSNVVSFNNFSLSFLIEGTSYPALKEVNLEIKKGSVTALIGESGCGKSALALSLIGLPAENSKSEGEIIFKDRDLLTYSEKEWRSIRGDSIAMIFQEPLTALNPLMRCGEQVLENLMRHSKISKKDGKEVVLKMLSRTGLHDVSRIYNSFPHQLSGGQRQRIMIAMAFINHPDLIIADEMTTALDVTVQAEIISLLREMSREVGTSVLLITHNLALVKNIASYIYIMYAGVICEEGEREVVLSSPKHPYTKALLGSIPSKEKRGLPLQSIKGSVPSLESRPQVGCPFAPRCPYSKSICFNSFPKKMGDKEHSLFCFYEEVLC